MDWYRIDPPLLYPIPLHKLLRHESSIAVISLSIGAVTTPMVSNMIIGALLNKHKDHDPTSQAECQRQSPNARSRMSELFP